MHYKFYYPFVFWERVENHEQIKEQLLPKIYRDVEQNEKEYNENLKWDCEVVSSFPNMDNSDLFLREDNIVESIVWNPFRKMLDEVDPEIEADNADLNQIWYNFYRVGNHQEIHDHQKLDSFSGIYLLSVNEPNTTVFYYPSVVKNQYFHTEHIVEGSVIIFPSHLAHYVKSCKKKKITISFNIEFE